MVVVMFLYVCLMYTAVFQTSMGCVSLWECESLVSQLDTLDLGLAGGRQWLDQVQHSSWTNYRTVAKPGTQ